MASLTGFAPVISCMSGRPLHWATRGGAHGRTCTDTVRVLSAPSLHWTTWAIWCRVKDSHPQPSRPERDASSVGLTRHMALAAGLSPETKTFEASRSDILSYGSIEIGGSPRIRTEFSPVKSRDFTVKVCN